MDNPISQPKPSNLNQQPSTIIPSTIVPPQLSSIIQPTDKIIKTCRICLQQCHAISQPNSQLIKPCRCSGSVQTVHQQCIKKWVQTVIAKKSQKGQDISIVKCQICKQPLVFSYRKKLACKSKQHRHQAIQQEKTMLYLYFLVLLFSGISICVLMYVNIKITGPQNPLNILIYAGYFVVAFSVMIWTIKIFLTFLIQLKSQVYKILPLSQKPLNNYQNKPHHHHISKQFYNLSSHHQFRNNEHLRSQSVNPINQQVYLQDHV